MIEQLYNSYPTDYRLQDLLQTFSFSNPHIGFVLTVAGITFLMGYLEYMYSFALVLWEKSAPFPIWMHTFYFAHDLEQSFLPSQHWQIIIFGSSGQLQAH